MVQVVEEKIIEMDFEDWVKRFNPIIEDNSTGLVKYYDPNDDVVSLVKNNHVWTYMSESGIDFIVPGKRVVNVMAYVITNEPWDIRDSGIRVYLK